MMDYFANLIANKTSFSKTAKIRKVYINEDPSQEETGPCPNCMARNQSSSVRYMYVNLQEAIYKCESPNCMYPFQNFKFKNYTDNTVYFYTSGVEETPPALDGFGPTFPNVATPVKCKNEHPPSMDESSVIDFSLHFFSPERGVNNSIRASGHTPGHNSSLNIFDSPSLSYKNLVQDFDTGFIDDILQDLGQPSPEKPKPVLVSPVRVETKSTTGRQLKRCLQMFKDTAAPSEVTFKVPPLPGSEVPSPPKIKSKKHSPLRRHKHSRRSHSSSGGLSSEKLLKKRKMKPLEFIETINSIHPKKPPPAEPKVQGVKPLSNQRVENMLNFIERSMKNRAPKSLAAQTCQASESPLPPKHSIQTSELRGFRKCHKRQSLSAAVLHDSQFEYSTSESEQEDAPDMYPVPMIETESDASLGSIGSAVSSQSSQQSSDSEPPLPSFENLLRHIHPGAEPKLPPNVSLVGFRSAGSSPTRVPQWAKTPPRRIHSMESLCSLE